MAAVNNKDIPVDFNMFGDLWNLYKKYYHPEDNDQYWQNIRTDFIDLSKKYGTKFSEELGQVVICELERKAKG
jgi:hypothetical protein